MGRQTVVERGGADGDGDGGGGGGTVIIIWGV